MRCKYGIGASSAGANPSSRLSSLMGPRSCTSPRRSHPDLDHLGRRLQSRLDAGARRRAALRDPCIPDLVHLVDGADVLQPDCRLQQLRLVGTGLGKKPFDGGEAFLRLRAHTLACRLIRRQACEIDGVAMNDDLAQPRPDIDAIDGHEPLPLDWSHPYTRLVQPLP